MITCNIFNNDSPISAMLYASWWHMAQDILVIPASLTPVERVFPKLGMHQVVEKNNWQVQT